MTFLTTHFATDTSPPSITLFFIINAIKNMKKKTSLIIITLFLAYYANSQITKRNWMTGGAASFRSSKYDLGGVSSKQTIVQLSGDVGYFIIDKLATGLKPGYSRTETNSPNNIGNTYEIGPFVRYYFLPAERYVNIFSELSYQYGLMKTNQGVKQNSNNFSGVLGCAAFFTSSVALEFTLGYSHYLYNNNLGKINSVIASIGFHFHLENEQ